MRFRLHRRCPLDGTVRCIARATCRPRRNPKEVTLSEPIRRARPQAKLALWLTVALLIAAALLGGYFIVFGASQAIGARAWLTLLLIGLFAGTALIDSYVSDGPNRWYLMASTTTNVALVAVGLMKIWGGWMQPADTADLFVWVAQLNRFFGIVALLRIALLVTQLYGLHFVAQARSAATKASAIASLTFVWMTALILAIPASFPEAFWPDWWWRSAAATALFAVVAAAIPILIRGFTVREER